MASLSEYDYHLPEELIAQTPLEERTRSRLLTLDRKTGELGDRSFTDLIELLRPGDLLVLNDTRVTALRLLGNKESGGAVEVLLLQETAPKGFKAMVKPAKRIKTGQRLFFDRNLCGSVTEAFPDGHRTIQFDDIPKFYETLSEVGRVPLPPYIHSPLPNPERYQTVIAKSGGSAAAPTAALHFSEAFLSEVVAKGIQLATVTLDVGIDTFRPVQAEDLDDHVMHGERCVIPAATALAVEECRGRIVAVGTTTVRTLETLAVGPRRVQPGENVSKLFIQPGFSFQIIDGMLTNFHLPRTTMLMMISALSGRDAILNAYHHAVKSGYRFLSFGDSMLIL